MAAGYLTSIWRAATAASVSFFFSVLALSVSPYRPLKPLLDLGRDLLAHDVVGQQQALLEFRVGKLAAQIRALLFVLLLLLGLFLHRDDQLVILVDMHLEILLGHTRGGDFHLVFVLILDDVDGRSRGVVAFGKPVVAQKIVENARQPVLITSYRYHSFVLLGFIWFNISFHLCASYEALSYPIRSNPMPVRRN